MTTVRDLLAGAELPRQESELLLRSLLGCDRGWIFAHGDAPVAACSEATFLEQANRRQAGEPLAYILGEREFWSLPLKVTPAVLIPRPDTEVLVQWAAVLLTRTPGARCLD
ncbi:MAG: protein-(glutamine-N5) methyltransferase, release factor-specific, partial [Luminiphilus sp.]|nr:protein-(glutamine-N5) methyltransferase, release factor-specific [Luminiphilus sp.]